MTGAEGTRLRLAGTLSAGLYKTRNVVRSDVTWNTAASLVFSVQSYIMLWLIQVTWGNAYAGIFSFATAQAFLFWSIGCYGMRRFQASDVDGTFTFSEYVGSRIATVSAMVLACAVVLVIQSVGHEVDRTRLLVIVFVTAIKVVDAVEDLFFAHLQQRGYLFIAGRISTIRSVAVLAAFCLTTIAGGGVVQALVVAMLVGTVVLGVVAILAVPRSLVDGDRVWHARRIGRLLLECLPLLAYSVLAIYLSNAPRYAIEVASPSRDLVQAEFGFLMTPAFVITLVSGFIYGPMIRPMAQLWAGRAYRALARQILRVSALITGIGVAACVAGYPFGTPLLSWLFRTDLSGRSWQFTVLLASGGLIALINFEAVVLTIMRRQLAMSLVNGAVAIFAVATGAVLVSRWGLAGACALAFGVAVLQAVALAVIGVATIARAHRSDSSAPANPLFMSGAPGPVVTL